MNLRRDRSGVQGLGTLLRVGTATARTDGQLLECFATRGGEAAELAFAALVDRHGPMVLRTCRSVLRDEHDALDAFQATFLALARRGGSLWVRDSVGPWLHRVALRAAARARKDAGRRREVERRAAEIAAATRVADGPDRDGSAALVHEEVDGLPERFRVPVVLCILEGRSHEEAARHLGCPVGTVKSRLARGRDRLRDRLIRRGLAPATITAALIHPDAASAAVPSALAEGTVAAAVRAGAVSIGVAALARGAVRSLVSTHAGRAASLLLAAGSALGGLAAVGVALAWQAPGTGPEPPAAPSATPKAEAGPTPAVRDAPMAWRRTDRYVPPDFEGFFPDDPEGAARLRALWDAPDKDRRPDDEILRTVRRGLRRASTRYQTEAVRWIGSRYVWGKSPQNPEAIEIMYHASGAGGERPEFNEVRNWAVYFGLSTVEPKTPAILRTLAELCLRSDDPNDLSRVAWGVASQRDEALAFVTPHLASADPARREKAALVVKILKGEVKAFEWATQRARDQMEAEFGARLPEIKESLQSPDDGRRREALELILRERLVLIMDDSFAPLLRPFADDPDPKLRRRLAQAVGGRWIWRAGPPHPDAVALELRLARDPDQEVRRDALYYGLARLRDKSGEEVVRALLDFGLSSGFGDMREMVAQGLDREAAEQVLDEALRGDSPRRAKAAREVYRSLTGKEPPPAEPTAPGARYSGELRDLHAFLARAYPCFALKGIDWAKVGDELLPLAERATTDDQFGLLVERLVARLEDSHARVLPGTARPPVPDLPRWDPGLSCLIDDRGRPVVHAVDRGSPAERAGIRPGQAVVSVDGAPAVDLIDAWMRRTKTYVGYSSERTLRHDAARGFLQQARRGTRLALVLEDPDGRRSTAEVEASLGPRARPRLPVPRPGIDDSADVSWTRLDGGIGYVSVARIPDGLEAKLDGALTGLGEVRGLILDVRGNSGGGFDGSTAFGNFDPAAEAGGRGRPRFAGPIALLIDERTISAGEGWASWFVARRRARLFGTTSSGASSRKTTYSVGDGLYRVVVPVKAYTGFLDRPIERRGLEPDVEVRCTAADLARGRDTVVEAAADWLREAGRE